jgi:hypothetical protein
MANVIFVGERCRLGYHLPISPGRLHGPQHPLLFSRIMGFRFIIKQADRLQINQAIPSDAQIVYLF